jgi:hypothetical protein
MGSSSSCTNTLQIIKLLPCKTTTNPAFGGRNQCSFIVAAHAPKKAPPILPEDERNLEELREE